VEVEEEVVEEEVEVEVEVEVMTTSMRYVEEGCVHRQPR
jgi:hypothetical protein